MALDEQNLRDLKYCSVVVGRALQNKDITPALQCEEGEFLHAGRCRRASGEGRAYEDAPPRRRRGERDNAFDLQDDVFARRALRDEEKLMWDLPRWVEKREHALEEWQCNAVRECTSFYRDIGVRTKREHARECRASGGFVKTDDFGNPKCSEAIDGGAEDDVYNPGYCRVWMEECMGPRETK